MILTPVNLTLLVVVIVLGICVYEEHGKSKFGWAVFVGFLVLLLSRLGVIA